jgi:hypothetical protein
MTKKEAEALVEKGKYLLGQKVTVRDVNKMTYKYDTVEYIVEELKVSCSPDTIGNYSGDEVCYAFAILKGVRDSQEVQEGLRALMIDNPPGKFK